MFVAFLGTKSGDPSRVVAFEGSTREVEECGLHGIMQGVTGSLNCYCPVQDPIQEVLEFWTSPLALKCTQTFGE